MRRGLHDLRVRAGFLGDLAHHGDEVVEGFAGLGFGWLDHHGFVDDEGEVDGGRVHAEVEQALGDVERGHVVFFLLAFRRCYELVLAGLWVGDFVV